MRDGDLPAPGMTLQGNRGLTLAGASKGQPGTRLGSRPRTPHMLLPQTWVFTAKGPSRKAGGSLRGLGCSRESQMALREHQGAGPKL